ncbi:MAG: hypothetical protein NVS2B12_42390 [Ktedonobacteraceae bacterium]
MERVAYNQGVFIPVGVFVRNPEEKAQYRPWDTGYRTLTVENIYEQYGRLYGTVEINGRVFNVYQHRDVSIKGQTIMRLEKGQWRFEPLQEI